MNRDIRKTELYLEADELFTEARRPGSGKISDASEIHVSRDGTRALFAGAIVEKIDGTPPTRVCEIELACGDINVLTFGPNVDRLPKYSPDGGWIAFLSDRAGKDDFQLYLLDLKSGEVRKTPSVTGWVEYLHWSPDGNRILLAAAGYGADISGSQGAVSSRQTGADLPFWMPEVEFDGEGFRWRCAWIYEVDADITYKIDLPNVNIWEAVWCGNDAIVAIASQHPGEGFWYSASLKRIEIRTGLNQDIYKPADQIGWPSVSPSGNHVAIVEGVSSDRWIVAGDLKVIEIPSGTVACISTYGIDVTHTEWRSDQMLLVAGHRGFETAVGIYDLARDSFTETWASSDVTSGGRYVSVSGLNEKGDCALVGESFIRAPEIALIRCGEYKTVRSFEADDAEAVKVISAVEAMTWRSFDDLEIQGWLLKPIGKPPYPLIVNVHGGPVWQWRPMWLGRRMMELVMLLRRGYAIFFPNPRGSTGRGQAFARLVFGDVGGAEAADHLSGIDCLVRQGIVDGKRIGVMGGSHGGFMSSWLIGQDARFAAAVPIAPITNWVSEHLTSNLPHFSSHALQDQYTNAAGKYFERSPIMHAHKVKTPTLNICGAIDRCTPPSEARQFHNALIENGVKSVLLTYPGEGHGIRTIPAMIDYSARVVGWFDEHISNSSNAATK